MKTESQDAGSATAQSGWGGTIVAFVIGLVAAVCILGLRLLIYGDADPFNIGWPLYLQAASLVSTVALAYFLRRPFVIAIGLYCGFVACMLASGKAEYPMASSIAFAVHGLVPALLGACVAYLLFDASWSPLRQRSVPSAGK